MSLPTSSSSVPPSFAPYQDEPSTRPQIYANPQVLETGGTGTSKYETQLPIRIDLAAAACYAVGPFSGLFFLIAETKNDYIRFHAWQSSLMFTIMLLFHLLFISAGKGWQWFFISIDVLLAGFFGINAYKYGTTLQRFEAPVIGKLAGRWVDTE